MVAPGIAGLARAVDNARLEFPDLRVSIKPRLPRRRAWMVDACCCRILLSALIRDDAVEGEFEAALQRLRLVWRDPREPIPCQRASGGMSHTAE